MNYDWNDVCDTRKVAPTFCPIGTTASNSQSFIRLVPSWGTIAFRWREEHKSGQLQSADCLGCNWQEACPKPDIDTYCQVSEGRMTVRSSFDALQGTPAGLAASVESSHGASPGLQGTCKYRLHSDSTPHFEGARICSFCWVVVVGMA